MRGLSHSACSSMGTESRSSPRRAPEQADGAWRPRVELASWKVRRWTPRRSHRRSSEPASGRSVATRERPDHRSRRIGAVTTRARRSSGCWATPRRGRGHPASSCCSPSGDRPRLRAVLDGTRRGAATGAPGVLAARTPTGRRAQFEIQHTNLLRRRARRRHRAEQPRRHRAQGVRGAADPPGVPRPADRPRQPRAVRRPRRACARLARAASSGRSR